MRSRLSVLLGAFTLVTIVGVWALFLRHSNPLGWSVVGGPLHESGEESRLPFAPAYWKRRCVGLTWHERRTDGEWVRCAGLPTGPRLELGTLDDTQEWTPPSVPYALDAANLIEKMRRFSPHRPEIMAWRRRGAVQEVLLADETKASQWTLSHVCVYAYRPGGSPDESDDAWGASMLESSDLPHRPGDEDIVRFTLESGWALTNRLPAIEAWGINRYAGAWATGTSRALGEETERLKSYTTPKRAIEHNDDGGSAVSPFALVPGRSVLLPETLAGSVQQQCSRPVPEFEATWTPTARDIEELEKKLPDLNARLSRCVVRVETCFALFTVNNYYRQYSGMVVKGRRIIYVNALHSGLVDSSWRTHPFVICDGGPAAWGVVYDPADHNLSEFSINGLA